MAHSSARSDASSAYLDVTGQTLKYGREKQPMNKGNDKIKSNLSNVLREHNRRETKHAQQIKNMKEDLERLEKENKDLKEKVAALEASQTNNEYERKSKHMQRYEAEIKTLNDKIESIEKDINDKNEVIAEKTQEMYAMELKIDKMKADLRQEQDKRVEEREDLIKGQQDLKKGLENFEKNFKRGQEEMMKMMKAVLDIRNDKQKDEHRPKRGKNSESHATGQNRWNSSTKK